MRRRKAEIRRRVNANLEVEFTEAGLSSYAGLELLNRYLRKIGLNGLLRTAGLPAGGDYGSAALLRMLLGLLIVGGRRLSHVAHLKGDVVFYRFCGLQGLPGERTVSRWLKGFRADTVDVLRRLNADLTARALSLHLTCRTLTVDVDGTVLSTGKNVGWAFRGYNPHHRKVPSYFPISAYLAESGHILRLRNRPGNINDGKASITFLKGLFAQIRQTMGSDRPLRVRMDGDFFKRAVLDLLHTRKASHAIKVPFWRCLDLQSHIRKQKKWSRIEDGIDGFWTRIHFWDRELKVAIFRKRVFHETRKNYQLDLFDPKDGTWEYSAITTDLSLGLRSLWRFMCGRGMHEKVIGELKTGLALDTIPTNHYSANSAWQQVVVLAHNLLTSFQIETGAASRPRSHKRTTHWILKSVRSLRFELINHAGRLVRPNGKTVLRLPRNLKTRNEFTRITESLEKAA